MTIIFSIALLILTFVNFVQGNYDSSYKILILAILLFIVSQFAELRSLIVKSNEDIKKDVVKKFTDAVVATSVFKSVLDTKKDKEQEEG